MRHLLPPGQSGRDHVGGVGVHLEGMDHEGRGEDGGDEHPDYDGDGATLAPCDRAKDDGFQHQADFGKVSP